MWLHPTPSQSELDAYYNGVYHVDRDIYFHRAAQDAAAVRRWVALAHPTPARMLEIGCSHGAMLAAFRDDGWTVEGVELDERAARSARERLGLTVWAGHLADRLADLHPPYDVVALYHVIEHVADPHGFARQLQLLCGTSGTVLLKTPNAASLVARMTGGWWQWSAAPEHVQLYSPRSIRTLLSGVGLPVRRTETRRGDAYGMGLGLLRAGAKRLLQHQDVPPNGAAPGSRPYQARPWFAAVRSTADMLGAPLDGIVAAGVAAGYAWGPELIVLAGGASPAETGSLPGREATR